MNAKQRAPILLVEDTKDDELLTLRAFKKAGIPNEIVVARDGVEALEYLFGTGHGMAPGTLPMVVLLDLNLPRLGGLDVLQRIRSEPSTRLLPVVVLTSSMEEDDLVRSYSGGANSYVRKPVDYAAFAEAAKNLGVYWLMLNETPPKLPTP